MIVAIDGPAGSGKSSLSRALAKSSDFVYLDTGAMYRALTLYCLENGIDVHDQTSVEQAAQDIDVQFCDAAASEDPELGQNVFLNGKEVTRDIRTSQIDENVSIVALYPRVRSAMVARQRSFAKQQNIIAEGRDIGTAVFPEAQVKIFLSADAKQRALRRTIEREGGNPIKPDAAVKDKRLYEKIYADILQRDAIDEERTESPLKPAPDAIHLDTTHLTLDQAVEKVRSLITQKVASL